MKIADIRTMDANQLATELVRLKREQFNLRFQVATGQLSQTHRIKGVRKEIARIKTVRREYAIQQKEAAGGRGHHSGHSGPVHAFGSPQDTDRANLELRRSKDVEIELMQAFRSLSARSVDRSAAIESLLRLGRQHQDRRIAARGLQRRLASIIPALVEELFDASDQVRWSAAYALAALRAPLRFNETEIPSPTPDLERSVRDELGRFLGDRPGNTLSHIRITRTELHGATLRVAGIATVLTHLPLELDGRRPSLAGPEWMRNERPALSVEITDRLGLLDETFPAEASIEDIARGELISRSFAFDLPADANTVLAVHVILNERRIAVHHIDSLSLLSD